MKLVMEIWPNLHNQEGTFPSKIIYHFPINANIYGFENLNKY